MLNYFLYELYDNIAVRHMAWLPVSALTNDKPSLSEEFNFTQKQIYLFNW